MTTPTRSAVLVSPERYETRDSNGLVLCAFAVSFTTPDPYALTGVEAWNVQGSGLTMISLELVLADGSVTVKTFPLPTAGKKVTLAVTDGQGLPSSVLAFTATVGQAMVNAAGFLNLGSIRTWTVF